MSRPKTSARSTLVNAILAATAFALLGYTLYGNREKIRQVFDRGVDGRVFAVGLALYMTALMLTFVRWWMLVRALGLPFLFRDAVRLGFIGNVFNLVIPGAVGGDLIKAAYLSREQAKSTQAIASMFIDRILGLLGLFLLAGVAGLFAWPRAGRDVRVLIGAAWVGTALGFLGLAAIFGQVVSRLFPGVAGGTGKVATILAELRTMSIAYSRRLGVVAAGLGMAMTSHAIFVLGFYAVSTTLFPDSLPSLADHFLMVPLTLFTMAVPLPFGALGLTEQVSKELFKLADHPNGDLAMLGFRVLMYGAGLISGLVYLANIRTVRALSTASGHLMDDTPWIVGESGIGVQPDRGKFP